MYNKTTHKSTLRVIQILNVISENPKGLTLSQLCTELDSPKSSLFPILHTLTENNFLSLDENNKFTIGFGCSVIAKSYADNFDILDFIYEEMQKVVSVCREGSYCASFSNGYTNYLKQVDSPEKVKLVAQVGSVLPAYSTGLGKALLIDHDLDDLKAIYTEPLKKVTNYTITNLNELAKQLVSFRKEDIAFEYQESTLDVQCIAVPIRKNGKIVYAISVATPTYRYSEQKETLIKSLLINAKHEIEKQLNN